MSIECLPNGSAIELMTDLSTLRTAWEHVRAAGGVAGADREDAARFALNLDDRLAAISESVREGRYAPLPALAVRIPKNRGDGERELAIPALEDRIVQRALLDTIAPEIDSRFLPCSHGYRQGSSVRKAVRATRRAIESKPWVADCDIHDFFGSVDHERLLEELPDWVDDEELLRLVRAVLAAPVLRGSRIDRPVKGLPLGSPISPLLANVFLHKLDLGLWRPDQTYVRYADDFVVCCSSQRAADDALLAADEILHSIGLSLAAEKSRVVDARSTSFIFLGRLMRRRGGRLANERESPARRTLYLTEVGSRVCKRKGRLIVEKEGTTLLEAPIARVREIHVHGAVQLTTAALTECLLNGIDVVFLTNRGRYLGRLATWQTHGPAIRHAQLQAATDPDAAFRIAKAMIHGKIANQRRLFQRHRGKSRAPELDAIAARLKPLHQAIDAAASLDVLRSVEGQASRCVFEAFPHFLREDFGFTGRRRRPPTDPVNSLLSFAYTLLAQEMASAVETAGLDPTLGFLHQPRPGRPSLALDLIEEFRPIVGDTLAIGLLNRHTIRKEHFYTAGKGAVLLRDEPRKTFLREYEQRLLTLFTYEPTGERLSYRRALLAQARQLARVVQEPGAVYVPVSLG